MPASRSVSRAGTSGMCRAVGRSPSTARHGPPRSVPRPSRLRVAAVLPAPSSSSERASSSSLGVLAGGLRRTRSAVAVARFAASPRSSSSSSATAAVAVGLLDRRLREIAEQRPALRSRPAGGRRRARGGFGWRGCRRGRTPHARRLPSRTAARCGELRSRRGRRRRARRGTGPPARGGSRRSRPARRAPRARRASRRTARGARRAPPSATTRTPCRGSAGGGTEMRRRPRSASDRVARAPCARARAAGRGRRRAAARVRAPSPRHGGTPCPRRHRARSPSRSSAPSVSRRAWSSAWIVGGTSTPPPRLPRERGHLLEEERIPLGGLEDSRPRPGLELDAVEQPVGELRGDVVVERLQQDRRRVQLPARPSRPDVEQLGPRDAEQEDRSPRDQSQTCSTRSSSGGSAQCRSSRTSTSGRSSASRFQQRARRELRVGRRRADRLARLDPELHRASPPAASR